MFERTGEKFNFKSYARGLNHCEERYYHVSEFLRKQGVTKVLDVGCNTGNFLLAMTRVAEMKRLVGLDMDEECLAESRGKLLSPEDIQYKLLYERPLPLTVSLYKGSILQRPVGFEQVVQAATLIEIIEHVDKPDLGALNETVFGALNPQFVVVTTPNFEFNVNFPDLRNGGFRHHDHRFEFNREEFLQYCRSAASYGYDFTISGCGEPKEGLGPEGYCTQIAWFQKSAPPRPLPPPAREGGWELVGRCQYPYYQRDLPAQFHKLLLQIYYEQCRKDEECFIYVSSLLNSFRLKQVFHYLTCDFWRMVDSCTFQYQTSESRDAIRLRTDFTPKADPEDCEDYELFEIQGCQFSETRNEEAEFWLVGSGTPLSSGDFKKQFVPFKDVHQIDY